MIAFLTLDKTVRAAGGVYAEKECICGMYVLNIKIKVGPRTRASRMERLYERAVRIMKRSGVENVCFQPPFVNEQYFIKSGFGELTSKYLRSRKVAEILRFVSPNALTAAVFAAGLLVLVAGIVLTVKKRH